MLLFLLLLLLLLLLLCNVHSCAASGSYDDTIRLWTYDGDEWLCSQTLGGGHMGYMGQAVARSMCGKCLECRDAWSVWALRPRCMLGVTCSEAGRCRHCALGAC